MKRILIALLFIACMSALASAQTTGYAFFAPGQLRGAGAVLTHFHFGGGAKHMYENRLGFGADAGIWGPKTGFGDFYGGNLSMNAYYKMDFKVDKLDPLLTIGYTRSLGHDSGANWLNPGGGINYWFKERTALLLEIRDYLKRENLGTETFKKGVTFNVWEIRLGLAFK
jgi:hypothetical protein